MKIKIENRQKHLKISTSHTKLQVKRVLTKENIDCDEVNIFFVDDMEI